MTFWKKISNLMRRTEDSHMNNGGFSLVELIIATAILAIVLAGVTSFMIIGTKNYSNANNEVTVQQEVQQAVNQIADAIIDASWSVGIEPKFVTPGENTKMLAVYNGIPDDPAQPSAPMKVEEGREKNYVFYWKDSGETMTDPYDSSKELHLGGLYYTEFSAADLEIGPDAVTCLLADKVTEFVIDTSESQTKNVVGIDVEVIRGNRTYTASANVTIRNKVMFNAYVPEYNDDDLPTITITAPLVVYLEPGDGYNLTATVNAQNVDTTSYHWEDAAGNTLADGPTGVSIEKENNNALKIGGHLLDASSYRSEHVIYAVSDAVDNKGNHARSMPVRIRVKRVREVRIDAVSDTVNKGDTFNLTGTVVGDYLNRTCTVCGDDADVYKLSTSGGYNFKYSDDGGATWKDCGSSTPFSIGTPTYSGSSFSVPVTLNSSVKTGTYTIRAYSATSVNKNGGYNALTYNDRVRGEVVLSTKGGPTRPRRASIGRLVYGSSADLAYGVFGSYDNLYLAIQIFNADGEWVRTFLMDQPGNNMRLDSDYFGIDWTKDYIVSIELFDKAGYDHYAFQNEYLNHLDENKLYNGTKLNMVYGFEGYMTPPTVNLRYEGSGGTIYANSPFTMSSLRVETKSEPMVYVMACSGMEQESYLYVGGRVQKKVNGEWVDFGYANMKKTGKGEGYEFTASYAKYTAASGYKDKYGDMAFNEISDREWRWKNVPAWHDTEINQAVGEYRVIPYINYKLGTMNKNSYLNDWTFYRAGTEDTAEHSMACPDSTFYFSILPQTATKYNLKELYTYINASMKKGDIYFPTPKSTAEFEKYFKFVDKVSATKEYTTESTFEFSTGGQNLSATFKKIKCTYDGKDTYTLQFFYDAKNYDWNRSAYNVETATYTCKKNDDEWKKQSVGPYDSSGLDLGYTIKDIWVFWGTPKYVNWWKGNLYVPLPWEDDFINNIKVNATHTSETLSYTSDFTFRRGSDNKLPEGGMIFSTVKFTCVPDPGGDSSKDKYYVELYYPYTDSSFGTVKEIKAGKWEATADKATCKQWTRVAGDEGKGELDSQLDNGTTSFSFPTMKGIRFRVASNPFEGDSVYPLPSQDDFAFKDLTSGSSDTKTQSIRISALVYGWQRMETRSCTVNCYYDGSTYTLTIRADGRDSKFEATTSSTEWTRTN